MFEEMKKIVMQGKEYPIKCDLLVLEKLQQEFGSLNDFENGLITMEEIKEEKMAEEAGDLEQELQRELGVEPEEKKEEENKKYKVKFPDMKCVKAALYYMVNEGEEIEAEREREGRAPVVYTREELGRKAGAAIIGIAHRLHVSFTTIFTGNRPEKVQKEIQEPNQEIPKKPN